MKFIDYFVDACQAQELDPKFVAKECGASKNTFGNWANGKTPVPEMLIKLSNYTHVSIDYLLTGKEPTIPTEDQSLISSYQELSKDNQQLLKDIITSMIDIQNANKKRSEIEYTTIRHSLHKVSAGLGEALDDEDNWEDIEVVSTPESEMADFAITVVGESMSPNFHDGDIVLVKEQPEIEIGQIGIFICNNEGFIKEAGRDRLISHNPKFDDIYPSENSEIICEGLVLGIAERVK